MKNMNESNINVLHKQDTDKYLRCLTLLPFKYNIVHFGRSVTVGCRGPLIQPIDCRTFGISFADVMDDDKWNDRHNPQLTGLCNKPIDQAVYATHLNSIDCNDFAM